MGDKRTLTPQQSYLYSLCASCCRPHSALTRRDSV
jgi:hypothetical protein